jgi:LPS export ABC transporter protein LptC/lipopolysaccharide transport protein LptA
MKRLRNWGLVALLVFLALEVLTIAPKKLGIAPDPAIKEAEERKKALEEKAQPSQVATMSQTMQGVHLVETGSGRKEWELDSQTAQGFRDKGTWKLKGVKVKFFSLSGSTYTVTGENGTVQTETKDMHIEGNVVTNTTEGYAFKTKSLTYSAGEKTLTTDEFVRLWGPKREGVFEITGIGLKADLQGSAMDILHDVRALKDITSDGTASPSMGTATDNSDSVKTMTIKSEKSHLNGKTSEVHFQDKVQVDIEAIRMTGNQADFLYDKKTHGLTSLLMQGNVRVTDQEHWASSQYAQVLFKQKEFVLYGDPRINQNGNELRGEEIRFLKGGKEVRVSKAKARVEEQEVTSARSGGGMLTKSFSKDDTR